MSGDNQLFLNFSLFKLYYSTLELEVSNSNFSTIVMINYLMFQKFKILKHDEFNNFNFFFLVWGPELLLLNGIQHVKFLNRR